MSSVQPDRHPSWRARYRGTLPATLAYQGDRPGVEALCGHAVSGTVVAFLLASDLLSRAAYRNREIGSVTYCNVYVVNGEGVTLRIFAGLPIASEHPKAEKSSHPGQALRRYLEPAGRISFPYPGSCDR
ncbi:hypothetical protein F5Y03DRAFT_401421 [Xylaria venustula]|nr:hypothetical protein F5Y03DRAFT_401421 [Xylaria venustula]